MSLAIPLHGLVSPASVTPVSRNQYPAILSNFLRRSSNTGPASRRCLPTTRSTTSPGSRCRRRYATICCVRQPSIKVRHAASCWLLRYSICAGIACRPRRYRRDVDGFEQKILQEEHRIWRPFRRAIAAAISPISLAAATRQAITPICGPRCWPMTAISGSWSTAV